LKEDLIKSPKDFGYDQVRWDGKLLSHHIRVKYNVQLKVLQCRYLFKQLGFSLQRPRKKPVGADPEKQEAFFRRESTITRSWYPRGNKSKVDCPATKEKEGVYGAISPRDGRLLSLVFDGFDSDTFLYYLK